jgi:hypothetical protein
MSCSTITSVRPAEMADQRDGLGGRGPAHAGGGLVEQDHACVAGDRDADLQRPLLGVGQHACTYVAPRGQPDPLENFVDPLVGIGELRDGAQIRVPVSQRPENAAAEVLVDRHPGEDVGDLEAARKAAAVHLERRQALDRFALEPDRTGRGGIASADQVEERRFAGAVGTDDRVPLALVDGERDAANDGRRAEALVQILQLQRAAPLRRRQA